MDGIGIQPAVGGEAIAAAAGAAKASGASAIEAVTVGPHGSGRCDRIADAARKTSQ
ncbi:Hypothetical protein BRADO6956 [Bradyrhizobium sp. ORS 278]|nr:Hypothetical protein BRADO6956 [Bradyrhizobium sp. ORS 278]